MPRKILINECYGGFSFSEEAKFLYKTATQHIPKDKNWYMDTDVKRDDPVLIDIVERMGFKAAGGALAELAIIEIPDDVPEDGWVIKNFDGKEWVAEKHRTWGTDCSSLD